MSSYNNYSSAYNNPAGGPSSRGSTSYSSSAVGGYQPSQGQQQQQHYQQQQQYPQMGGGPVEGTWMRDSDRSDRWQPNRNRSRSPTDKFHRSDRSSRRSRSRSRSRSPSARGRGSNRRGSSRSRSRSRERERRRRSSRSPPSYRGRHSRSPHRRSPPESNPPSPKVILINLPVNTDRDVINIMIAKQGFHPVDIRIVRKTSDSGSIRIFGFVEFSDTIQAQAWINYNKGHFVFEDGYMVKMEFSRELDSSDRRGNGSGAPSSDWTCAKCTINNFNRRSQCFKCGTSRQDSEQLESKGYALVGISPCDTLLIRELPASVSEESIRRSLSQYTTFVAQRIHLALSRSYALVQMRTVEESASVMGTFNKVVPYVDNCAVIITFSRQSLNQILIMDNVNMLKSQGGITSVNIHEDPTNSAAALAQNAMRMVQMGRLQNQPQQQQHDGNPTRQSISTPFGYLQSFPTPNPKNFQLEPQSGYYFDPDTGYYFDPKTEYFYNSKVNQWMFWCSKYSTYIPCEGGDVELKRRLQEEEKDDQRVRNSAVISAPPSLSNATVAPSNEQHSSEEDPHVQIVSQKIAAKAKSAKETEEESGQLRQSRKKQRRKEAESVEDSAKPKSAQEIAQEMAKWARRQGKVKMTFKQPEQSASTTAARNPSSATTELSGEFAPNVLGDGASAGIVHKKPWAEDDDDDEEARNPKIPDAALLGTSRMRNVGLPLNYRQSPTVSTIANEQPHEMPQQEHELSVESFDEERFLDRVKSACLLCQRKFPSAEVLGKHIQMSDLHKSNVAAKVKELSQAGGAMATTTTKALPSSTSSSLTKGAGREHDLSYRDRAKERRQLHGYDPSGLAVGGNERESDVKSTEAIAAYKASVPLDESNIGNKMLKSMGWTEGQGLGINLQGIVNPVTADQRVQGVGLGASGSKLDSGGAYSRKDRLKQAAIQRFNDIAENE